MEMTNQQAAEIGKGLIQLLNLEPIKDTRKGAPVHYDTDFGPKSVEGLGRCMVHVMARAGYVIRDAESVVNQETKDDESI